MTEHNATADLAPNLMANLENCRTLLEQVSTTCCMKERSSHMNEAFLDISKLKDVLDKSLDSEDNVHLGIETVGELGRKLGYLFATCCTETREPLYQQMYKELNKLHNNFWLVLGHGH